MELTEQQTKLLGFVKQQHGDQKRKYTNEPYWHHLVNVATIVDQYEKGCIEIALCHDLFEDTKCEKSVIEFFLYAVGYDRKFADEIVKSVEELSDVFTKENYPYLNRKIRKECESMRLSTISYKAMCVKYADMIDNTGSIAQHDKNFAKTYLIEKANLLKVMRSGNKDLYELCSKTINK